MRQFNKHMINLWLKISSFKERHMINFAIGSGPGPLKHIISDLGRCGSTTLDIGPSFIQGFSLYQHMFFCSGCDIQ